MGFYTPRIFFSFVEELCVRWWPRRASKYWWMFGVEGVFLQTRGDLPVMLNSLKFVPQAQELCVSAWWSVLTIVLYFINTVMFMLKTLVLVEVESELDGRAVVEACKPWQKGYWVIDKPILDFRDLWINHLAKLEVSFEKDSVISCGINHFQLIMMVCLCGGTAKGFWGG